MRSLPLTTLPVLLAAFISLAASAADLQKQREALDVIADFAERICTEVPLEGGSRSLELEGKVGAELNGLLKKLVDLDIEGSGKYQNSKFKGLLREDLLAGLKDSTSCKLKVFSDLKDKLLADDPR